MPPAPRSNWADEGSAAHRLGEWCLSRRKAPFEYYGREIEEGGAKFKVDADMVKAVTHYVQRVMAHRAAAGPDAIKGVEATLWSRYLDNTGTVDSFIISTRRREVWVDDYKHGKGVYVGEANNEQLMSYAVSAVQIYGKGLRLEDFTYHLTVHQPRFSGAKPSRTWTVPGDHVRRWVDQYLVPGLKAAEDPDAAFKGGAHCRFCPAKNACTVYLTVERPRFGAAPIQATPIPEGFTY